MKKGFTLVELIAVIIILAILMIIAIPSVLGTLEEAKMNTFNAQAKSIWQSAEQKFIIDSILGEQKECYGTGELDLASIAPYTSYYVYLDTEGKVTGIKVQDPIEKYVAEGTTINGITVRIDESLTSTSTTLSCDNSD